MAALVSIADFQTFMKTTFTGDDLDQAILVLAGISGLARAVAGRPWPLAPTDVPDDVQVVVMLGAKRMLHKLGRDESVRTEEMGPFAVTYFDNPDDLFTKGELGILRRFRTKSGLFTIGSSRGETARCDDWWHVDNPFRLEWENELRADGRDFNPWG